MYALRLINQIWRDSAEPNPARFDLLLPMRPWLGRRHPGDGGDALGKQGYRPLVPSHARNMTLALLFNPRPRLSWLWYTPRGKSSIL